MDDLIYIDSVTGIWGSASELRFVREALPQDVLDFDRMTDSEICTYAESMGVSLSKIISLYPS